MAVEPHGMRGQQGQPRRPARIILNRLYRRFHPVLIALEIHQPYLLLVAAANPARGNTAIHIPAAGTLPRLNQSALRLGLRNVAVIRICDITQ